MKWKITTICFVLLIMLTKQAGAQQFGKGFYLPFELGQGMVTQNSTPEYYWGGVGFVPQYTLKEGLIRGGLTVGGYYSPSRIQGIGGPRLALKLFEGPKILTASAFNVHLTGECLWDTKGNLIPGGGIAIETGRLFGISATWHRNVDEQVSWFRLNLAINFFPKKIPEP